MMMDLQRYSHPISQDRLPHVLRDPSAEPTEIIGHVDLEPALAAMEAIIEGPEPSKPAIRSRADSEMVQPLHKSLRTLPRRITADMRLWHRLCTTLFQPFVWYRWHGSTSSVQERQIPAGLASRFLGTSTLVGVARNALARLFWCAETLWTPEDEYRWAEEALKNQDLFTGLFERALCLHPPCVVACLKALGDKSEAERRSTIRRLNHYFTTILLETLDEDRIGQLIKT